MADHYPFNLALARSFAPFYVSQRKTTHETERENDFESAAAAAALIQIGLVHFPFQLLVEESGIRAAHARFSLSFFFLLLKCKTTRRRRRLERV